MEQNFLSTISLLIFRMDCSWFDERSESPQHENQLFLVLFQFCSADYFTLAYLWVTALLSCCNVLRTCANQHNSLFFCSRKLRCFLAILLSFSTYVLKFYMRQSKNWATCPVESYLQSMQLVWER